ncbi:MAG: PAS domain S-box protein, partial [Pseudomonadota bacterium]|nr:PAS domain S-box protein [Pseudomonadota bacterium]
NNSAHINELFQAIEPHYQTLLKTAQAFLDSVQPENVLEQLFIAEKTFLSIMDAIVFEYAQEALIHVKFIKYLETIQVIIILIAVLLVGLGLFRPAIKKIQEIFSELQFSEMRWRYLSQVTLEGLALHEQGQLQDANASLIQMFGYPLEELKTKNIIDLVSKDARKQLHQQFTSKSSTYYEVMGLHKNGSCFPVALSLDYIVSEGTSTAIARFQDLSQRKQMEALVQQQQQQLQTVLDNTPAVIYIKDVYGQYQLINQQYEQLFQVHQETIRGQTDHDIFPHAIADTLKSNDNQVIIKKQALKFEEEVLQEDGLHTYISVKFPLYDAQEQIYAVCGISTDITERKWMEEALRQRETTLRALLDAIPESVLLIDKHYRILNANKTVVEQLQTAVFNGANLFNFLPLEVAAQRKKYVDQVIASGQAVRFEDRCESTYFAHSIYPILNKHREVIQLALFSADISTYKQTQAEIKQLNQELEQRVAQRTAELEASNHSLHQEIAARQHVEIALRQSEAQFRLLIESISAVTLICQQGQIIYANPAAVLFTGYSLKQLSQIAVWELLAPEFQEQFKQFCLRLPHCEQLKSHYELQCLTQQGQLRWLDLTVQSIEYQSQESILVTAFELTERKRMESILRHLIEKISLHTGDNFLKSLVNHLAETLQVRYVFIGQLNSNNPQMVTAVHVYDQKNDIIEQFDYSLAHTPCEQVITQKTLCCYPHAVQKHFPLDDMLTRMAAESYCGTPLLDSYDNLVGIMVIIDNNPLENNDFIASLLQIFALRAAAEIQRLHALALLETERADLAQRVKSRTLELTQTNLALEQALRHKDEFLASMSHELRTPLNIILNNLELLEEGIYGALTLQQQQALTTMKDNGVHLLTLITDILDWVNIEAGQLELVMESFEVEPFCQACLSSIKPLAQKKQLQVDLN